MSRESSIISHQVSGARSLSSIIHHARTHGTHIYVLHPFFIIQYIVAERSEWSGERAVARGDKGNATGRRRRDLGLRNQNRSTP